MSNVLKALAAPMFLLLLTACSSPLGAARPTASPSTPVGAGAEPGQSPAQPGSSPASVGSSPAARTGSSGSSGTSSIDSCLVGRWQSAAFSGSRLGSATISGGAGVNLEITNSGDLTVNYSGMQPVQIQLGSGSTGTGSLDGVAHAVITTNGGTITPSNYDGSGVRVNAVLHSGNGVDTPVNLPLGDVFGASVPENYTCDRGSITLVRQGPLPNLVYRRR
jgi:hypothetical protein